MSRSVWCSAASTSCRSAKENAINVSNKFLDAVIGGWQVDSIVAMQTGVPIVVTGANNLATRPNSTGQSAKLSDPTATEWFNTSAFINPATYTYGNLGRVLPDVRNPGLVQVDLSIIKNWRIRSGPICRFGRVLQRSESCKSRFRKRKLLSRHQRPQEVAAPSGQSLRPANPRNIQLGMKLTF